MSVPIDAILQYSSSTGDIAHQGVLGSNVSGTTLWTNTFPTTSTGDSLGHYHYTEDVTNSLKFLNASGTGQGGHQFWHSSSTDAPTKVFEANRNETLITTQFKVDKSSTPPARVFSPPIDSLSPDNSHIEFPAGTDLTQPPYNFNQTFNPVYMTQGNGFYTDNSLVYVFVTNGSSQIQIFNNNSTTNPIPPNVYPSDFPTTDTIGLIVGQPVFALTPYVPPIPQTAILNDTLEITTDTDVSVLTATDLTFNSVSLQSTLSNLTIKQTNALQVYNSPAIYADSRPPIAVPNSISNTYAQFGWYFKNTFASNNKINWYMPPATGMKVSDILGLYMRYFNCSSTTSNDDSPYLVVYTTPTGTNDYAPGFFHSAMVYIINTTPVINTSYTMFMNVSGTCPTPSAYASNIQTMIQSPVNNPRGTYAPTDSVLAFVIGTNSASARNSVEFIAQKLGVITPTGTQELLYQTI
jgi:hypothetical protein